MDMTMKPEFQALQAASAAASAPAAVTARSVNVYYGTKHAIKDLDVDIPEKAVTAFIGPSGCGKSTFLRCINRMNDTISICKVTGDIRLDGSDIYDKALDVVQSRHTPLVWCPANNH